MNTLSKLRAICLRLPEAEERETWEIPTFRVRNRIFAMAHPAQGRASVWMKAPRGVQTLLIEAAPERFFRPPYVGHKGWIGIWLDVDTDWEELDALVVRSWRMTAPKRLAATLPGVEVSNSGDTPAEPSRRRSPPSRTASSRRRSASAR